jgi:hypothetical protein
LAPGEAILDENPGFLAGFTEEFRQLAATTPRIRLVDLDDIYDTGRQT